MVNGNMLQEGNKVRPKQRPDASIAIAPDELTNVCGKKLTELIVANRKPTGEVIISPMQAQQLA